MENNSSQNNVDSKKKITNKMICIILIILAILLIVFGVFFILKKKSENNRKVLVYVNNDNDLKYISSKNNKPIMLSKSFEEKINVKFNQDKTKLAYIKNRGLYLNKIDSNDDSEKLGVDIEDFRFTDNDHVLFIDVNKNLYIATKQDDKKRIDIDVTNVIYVNINFVIYNKGEEVYLYNTLKDEKNSILKDYDATKRIYVSDDVTKILYVSKDSEIKIYDVDQKKSSVKVSNVYDIVGYDNNFTNITYTKLGEKKKYYDLFINDKVSDNPIVKYQCKFHSFEEYISGGKTLASDSEKNIYHLYEDIDFYIYFDDKGQWHDVSMELYNYCKGADPDAKLKEQIRKDETTVQLYDLYSFDGKENYEISKDMYEVLTSKDNIYVYTKLDISDANKIRISSLSSIDDVKDLINQVKPTLYYSSNDKKDELLVDGLNTKYKDNIDIVNDKIYVYEVNDKKEIILYEYDTKTFNKEKISSKGFILDTNVMNYDILYLDNYNVETAKGDLIGRKNNVNTNIDVDVYSVIENDDNKLYYYKDFDFKKLNGSFVINNIQNSKKEVIDDISLALKASSNMYYLFKDYSTTSKTYSLFLYSDGKQEPIEYNVKDYVYSD